MTSPNAVPVFDGHNDVLLRLKLSGNPAPETLFIEGDTVGHIDLPRAKKGGLAGGLCAIFVPSPQGFDADRNFIPPSQSDALATTLGMASLLFRIESASDSKLKVCRSASDIRDAMANGAFASVLHIEGVEAFDADLDALYVLHQAGLRTLGPVWSRPNMFAHGVPFRFPSTPDIGPGLTEAGTRLIKTCNELKIMVDLSHMNEQGFWDIAKISNAPLVASHSNAHALCNHSRNLTDRQLYAIRDTGGLAGINFGVLFVRQDGVKNPDTNLSELVRHVDYMVERMGIDHVALGSDFDGTTIPAAMKDASDLQLLVDALRDAGYDQAALDKICHGNWVRVLETTWGA
ncbi:dipeptidase [Agrobacterium rosae]|uniref:Peptidase n=1 Tax=Agrobacterium rosae TaxID=1972867 RepID=A0AAE5RYR7_9HYPH|nr:dipeptidase [Agrobacterium rosae]KAA3511728.1 membrane dipeptidase [Agrobacterium rosae]KAA3519186.1 membrane dipeptidase [Agrobacterium rosae]MCM2435214.1 membrane dipeptidase [Agrobacterium rosae]MDX8331051.1 dipeptidase [Agrobacterium rosae]MQB49269.1 membrane dipeptidase [Agrobacterium rosae]